MVPTTFTDSFLDGLPSGVAWGLYGSLPHEPGLRNGQSLPKVTAAGLASHVKAAAARGIPFYYALNHTCFGAQEFTAEFQRSIVNLLAWLEEAGVVGVIVASPYLAEVVKNRSSLKVHVSLGAQVDNLHKVVFWQELGADGIYLDDSLNRDFETLASAQRVARCQLFLSVNTGCVLHCPLRVSHGTYLSHSHQRGPGFFADYALLRCSLMRATSPTELLRLPWIRPEDLSYYESLGFSSFKIWGRTNDEGWLLRVARAYAARSYQGDLNDLLDPLDNVLPFGRSPYRVRNGRLDGFLNGLVGKPCRLGCGSCRYCHSWAQRAIETEFPVDDYRRSIEAVIERLTTGCFRPSLSDPCGSGSAWPMR